MFAVPGWNVSAKSLAREQPASRSGPSQVPKSTSEAPDSKKRKRPGNDAKASRKIEGNELEKLWNQRFGEKPAKGLKKTKKPNIRPHLTQNGEQGEKAPRQDRKDNSGSEQANEKKKQKKQKHRDGDHQSAPSHALPSQPPPSTVASNLTPLQLKMRNKLTSARFRHLNQTLYTTPSADALSLFTSSPDLFSEYHAGFTLQVQSSWPTNPIDTFITSIKARGHLPNPTIPSTPLPRRKTLSCTIADLGCGDAPLARTLTPSLKSLHLKIHSYDLFSPNSHVTVADISKLPLRDGEADIALFCLSLMGTNWIDFIEESWRILRGDGKGELWVAEVKSRFARKKDTVVDHSVGKQRKKGTKKKRDDDDDDEMVGQELFASSVNDKDDGGETTDISPFVSVLERRGFKLQDSSVDKTNKMFVSMIFHKAGVPSTGKYKGWKWNGKEYAKQPEGKTPFLGAKEEKEISKVEEGKVLKPCVYKSR